MRRLTSEWLSLAVALALLVCGGSVWAQIADINSAINEAGRQRMLSQRIAKAYFQIGQDIEVERSRRILDTSIALFDRQLVDLRNFAPTPEIKDTYLRLGKLWQAYKEVLLSASPSKESGRAVLGLSDDVLRTAQQGTVQLEKHSGTSAGRLVNIAGRQRMLSQRMAKLYQAINWGLGDSSSAGELDKAKTEFIAAHEELKKAAGGNRPLTNALELVGRQWIFFEAALAQRGGDKQYFATDVAAASEFILQEMEVAVGLFEKQQK